jgi:hypothetical protein
MKDKWEGSFRVKKAKVDPGTRAMLTLTQVRGFMLGPIYTLHYRPKKLNLY